MLKKYPLPLGKGIKEETTSLCPANVFTVSEIKQGSPLTIFIGV